MDEKSVALNNYIEEYKKLNVIEKRDEFISSLKELIVVFEHFAQMDNIQLEYVKNKEILDLSSDNVSEDDFLEAAMVYLEISKDIIGQYLSQKN